ncbi:MAG: protein translocase subunit SecD [Pseudomonadota bacterium]
MKWLKWRALMILLVLVGSVMLLVPTISGQLPSWWSSALPADKIHLGLDLQGGMHMVLQVEAEKAVENTLDRAADNLKEELRRVGIRYAAVERKGFGLTVQLLSGQDRAAFEKVVGEGFSSLAMGDSRTDDNGLTTFELPMPVSEQERIRKMAVDQAKETVSNRIDQFGVAEPDIRRQGENELVVQLPGIKDPQRAVKLIGQTALLEFKLVDETANMADARSGKVPPGSEVLYETNVSKDTGRTERIPVVVRKRAMMTGEGITGARVQFDRQSSGEPHVLVSFDSPSARLFGKITTENVKRRLAIVLDNNVYSSPVIREPITDGDAIISGQFSLEEAHDLAIVLRAGSLPAPVKIIEERTVGPSLGRDSIRLGLLSALLGSALVVGFMLIYYKTSGLIATMALCINIILILAGMAAFKATLTLPGIAGIVLTIGMAVDANILILERMREELRWGKTFRAAVDAGYTRAMVTIFDCNLTTIATALILYQFGTGPIRGFGVTLILGIIASFFTAVFVTRVVFDYLLVQRRLQSVSL